MSILLVVIGIVAGTALFYVGRGYWGWVLLAGALLLAWALAGARPLPLFVVAVFFAVGSAVVFGVGELRRRFVSSWLIRLLVKMLPRMGETERIALEAGTVWWDAELFSGAPDWRKLLDFQPQPLSVAEREFLDGPVEKLCQMIDDWDIAQRRDLPPEVWAYIKRERFFGMIIPEQYDGLGFSALAHSAVVTKLASRSVPVAVTVMVPNSLGPAELLLHYGTDDQKQQYLPRLARGEEIPCFALTGPEAGSDAAATQSNGVVCRGTFRGEELLGIRLNWRKRYITLAPVATVIGLAFRLLDPDRILGDKADLGITCALIPRDLPGIEIGQRHDPMGVPFQNGPTVGRDVFVPLDFIIGGSEGAGQGWRMLMESLAAGRTISLPALAVGAVELAARLVGAYATVREQFDTPIGRFEGIEEILARIGAHAYFMNAARTLTCSAVDAGERPAVLSAIVKAYLTEGMRQVVNDAMDLRAGAAICKGPRNVLARAYIATPIGITVEGSNILTRSMIIYGQGAIRCHPFIHAEMTAARAGDIGAFDTALFGHLNFGCRNAARAWVLGLTGARLAAVPKVGKEAGYLRRFSRFSAAFALVSDMALVTLGGTLKRREKISGRLADALAWLYLGSCALKRFCAEGRFEKDEPLLAWSCQHALWQIQQALLGVIDNLPNRPAAWLLRVLIFPLGARQRPPRDALGARVARGLLEDRGMRKRLTTDIFVPPPDEPGLGHLEAALEKATAALAVEAKLRDAVRAGNLDRAPGAELADNGVDAGVITSAERARLDEAAEIRDEVIQVDAFEPEVYRNLRA